MEHYASSDVVSVVEDVSAENRWTFVFVAGGLEPGKLLQYFVIVAAEKRQL